MSILIDSKGKLTKVAFLNGHCEQTAVKNLKRDYYRVIKLSRKHGIYFVIVHDLLCDAILNDQSFVCLQSAYKYYKQECSYHKSELKYRIDAAKRNNESNILTQILADFAQ